MLTFEEKLAKYAELLIGLGVNLQKGAVSAAGH